REEQGFRPAPLGRAASHDPRARRRAPHQRRRAGPQAGPRHGVRHHERRPAQAVRRVPRVRLLVRDRRTGPLSRQRLQPEPRRGRRVPDHPVQDPDARAAERAQDLRRPGPEAARPGAGDRPHRLGQVHHAGGDGQLPQRNRVRPHPDGGRPDRVRARVQEVPDQPARSGADDAVVRRRAEVRAARRPRRDPGGRNARPGNDPPGDDRGRDRPPGVRHAAHLQRGQDHRPDHRRLPGGRKRDGARHAVRIAAGGDLADAVQDQGRRRPGGGARDHAGHVRHPQPDPRGQGGADVFGHPDRQQRGHADAGPEPHGPGQAQHHQPGGSPQQSQDSRKFPGL
ncbi:MAG: Twitching motility protein PilT, partial [uncultured Ramlibacter sp.]